MCKSTCRKQRKSIGCIGKFKLKTFTSNRYLLYLSHQIYTSVQFIFLLLSCIKINMEISAHLYMWPFNAFYSCCTWITMHGSFFSAYLTIYIYIYSTCSLHVYTYEHSHTYTHTHVRTGTPVSPKKFKVQPRIPFKTILIFFFELDFEKWSTFQSPLLNLAALVYRHYVRFIILYLVIRDLLSIDKCTCVYPYLSY